MLPDSSVVERVVSGPGGVLDHARRGSVVVDMSTIDPRVTDRLATAAADKGIGFVDAPVGRLSSHAERGESLFMVGASDDDFQRVRPLLEAMGTTIHHCGAVGTGIRTKLVNNYLAIILCQLNAEALALSQRFGLDLAKTLDVINGTTATNGQIKINWPNKVLAGDTDHFARRFSRGVRNIAGSFLGGIADRFTCVPGFLRGRFGSPDRLAGDFHRLLADLGFLRLRLDLLSALLCGLDNYAGAFLDLFL